MVIYITAGKRLARGFYATGNIPVIHPIWSTAFIRMFTSWVMIVVGESVSAVLAIYSIIGFWGQYLYFRAFRISYPNQDPVMPALLMFFLPSIAYWTSAIGKDSLMIFASGLTVYAASRIRVQWSPSAMAQLVAGMGGCLLVRPHVAALLAVSLVVPYLLNKSHRGIAGVLGKLVALPLLLWGLFYLVLQAQTFVALKEMSDASRVLNRVGINSSTGGSMFGGGQSLAQRILYAPFLLFRPFPWEANNLQAMITSLEGVGIFVLLWKRKRKVLASLREFRDDHFVFFVILYSIAMAGMLAGGISNFGLLARQRVMMLAPVMLLICREPSVAVGRFAARAASGSPLPRGWVPDGRVPPSQHLPAANQPPVR